MDERLDLAGIAPEHRAPATTTPRWLSATVLGCGATLLVAAVLQGHWGNAGVWVVLLLPQAAQLVAPFRPVLVRVHEDALHVRRGLRLRRVPWGDVAQVLVQGRWDEASTAVLRDGQHLRLPGLPREDADRLAAALERSRPDVPRSPDPSPRRVAVSPPVAPEDFDWEGPFRRGPGR